MVKGGNLKDSKPPSFRGRIYRSRGGSAMLHSDISISLIGTQMLFFLPDVKDKFYPMLRRQAGLGHEKEGSDGGRRAARRQPPPSNQHPLLQSGERSIRFGHFLIRATSDTQTTAANWHILQIVTN
ncbi:hypothetical protein BU16DRAFT_544476 [Lophium mytilinum]|uniref:Uncharacterized protein n=1 Tax=Lophium mytilinum TaxID=390894 RepID=A0A6A6QDH0_9PEZI|nr:hypothetical protein BU16DRAFT_544476 [Lophium mytilinum]